MTTNIEIKEVWKSKTIETSLTRKDGTQFYSKRTVFKKGNTIKGEISFKNDGAFFASTNGIAREFSYYDSALLWLKMLNQPIPIPIKGIIYSTNITVV